MDLAELRSELEEDLSWRLDEIRHLRNELLGDMAGDPWPIPAMRAILVMQYAHLEGFAKNSFSLYVTFINERELPASEIKSNLFASALIDEFEHVRNGRYGGEQDGEEGRLLKRARHQVGFINRIRSLHSEPVAIDPEAAVSMEMNFGSDVLRRTLYRLGIPESAVGKEYFKAIDFVRRMRNDIAHGSRKERIERGAFEAHQRKCEEFMNNLTRLISQALGEEWYRQGHGGH